VTRLIVNTILVLLVGAFLSVSAAPDAIGIATARGGFIMDRSPVQGNTTLFEGGVLETNAYSSVVRLQSGNEMRLGATSRGRIYRDRLVLEKGEGQIDKASNFRFEALGLRILPDSSGTKARVALLGNQRVAVSALAGTLHVTTAEGALIARLEPGAALEFEPQAAGASAPFSVSGCVAAAGDRLVLEDATSNVSFELRGQNLERYAGQRVEVSAVELKGEQPGEGATQVIQVTRIYRLTGSCAVPPAAAKGSSGGAATAKTVGMAGTTKVVIAGVAIAAVAGGTALGLTRGDSTPSVSR
jgi:hypothetical protein